MRYRLMDYMYTAFHTANTDGTPVLHPLFFKYPKDANVFNIDLQFFYGDSILVSPVVDDDSTSVSIYLPKDIFYDFTTLAPVQGTGANITLPNVNFTTIPVHIKGGAVLPLRAQSAMTTTELRKQDFEFVIAPDTTGSASGSLYIDDGESIVQNQTTEVTMSFKNKLLQVSGSFKRATGVNVSRVRLLGVSVAPKAVSVNGIPVKSSQLTYNQETKVLDVSINQPFTKGFSVLYL